MNDHISSFTRAEKKLMRAYALQREGEDVVRVHFLTSGDVRAYCKDVSTYLIASTAALVETLLRRSQGGGVLNTAYIERLNATFRERLAPLARRCRALARHTLTLHEGMCVVGTVYNLCTPHASLSSGQQTTPAMAAGITDHGWTMHDLLAFHVPLSRWSPPKQRGRPSQALKRLTERWCGNHD